MAVDVQLRHRRDHGFDLVLLARQGRDELPVMQTGCRRGQSDLHQRDRVRRQLQESGVPVVHGIADALGEMDAVSQALLPVVDAVDHLTGADVGTLVHGGEVAGPQRLRVDTLQFGGQFAQQRIHLRGVAGPLGLELPGELALGFAALDDRVHLGRWPADHGLGGGGVHAHLQVGEIRENSCDLVGRVLDQCHQPDVLAEQHRLTLAHQMRTGADGSGGVGQRQTTGEVGCGGLAE